jgi:hypothetical protein
VSSPVSCDYDGTCDWSDLTSVWTAGWHDWIGTPANSEPQIGMNIFQFGAFTQAYRFVKGGTVYTAAGIGTVAAAPTVAAAAPYAVSGYEASDVFLIEWAAGDFEGYTATMEMLRGLVNADIVPESLSGASVLRSWVGCLLWGDDPCPGILKP